MRVLIIEDDVDFADSLEEIIVFLGHRCEKAHNGLAAMALLDAIALIEGTDNSISVVFTDLIMPRMNGLLFCIEFKKRWPYTPIVLISGTPALSEDGFFSSPDFDSNGFFAFLKKPFELEKIAQIIHEIEQLNQVTVKTNDEQT